MATEKTEQRDRPAVGEVEKRTFEVSTEGKKIRGVIPYGVESKDMGNWTEIIEPGALRQADLDDLVARVDHAGVPIGRYPKTLELDDRTDGLHWSVVPPESRADLREAIQRGDLRAGSWEMVIDRDRWDGDTRHVEAIAELRDVSVVSSPAYPASAVEYRAAPTTTEEKTVNEERDTEEQLSSEEKEVEERSALPNHAGSLKVEDRQAKPKKGIGEDSGVEFVSELADFSRDIKKGETRALSTAITLSNPQYGDRLFDMLRPQSVFLRSGVQTLSTDSERVIYPLATSDPTLSWTAEAGTITASDPVFAAGTVTPHKLAVRVVYSNEVAEDSSPALETVLRSALAARGAVSVDIAAFEGSGTGSVPRGIGNNAGTTQNAAANNLKWAGSAIKFLEGNAAPRPYAYVGAENLGYRLREMRVGTNGTALDYAFPIGAEEMPSLWGASGYIQPLLHAGTVYVYSPSSCFVVNRTSGFDVEVDRSRLFHTDQSEMRLRARLDIFTPYSSAVWRGTAFPA
jgi:HK97 family phage major capsid protein/HK97 family phage prohead protease